MNNPRRVFFFKHYWWITALLSVVGAGVIIGFSRPDNVPGNLVALSAGALGVVYFVQKQKLDDLQLFERLFTQFNLRYAEMHADLQRVATNPSTELLQDRAVLDDYFNLCAEEYLFYSQGRILPSVWQAWCRGMREYLKHERFRKHWKSEEGSGSHYSLTYAIIIDGSGLPPLSDDIAPQE